MSSVCWFNRESKSHRVVLLLPGTWRNARPNFDNLGVSMLTLFEVSTLEGWVDIMHSCMDATNFDQV